jgi:hypothetical protein
MYMRVSAFCWQCLRAAGNTKESYDNLKLRYPEMREDRWIPFNDVELPQISCPVGHVTYVSLSAERFELLFDFGAMALLDGYARESVAAFTASLERFYEFYLRVIAARHDSSLIFKEAWKAVQNASERQLGGFIFARLFDGHVYRPDEKRIAFRNRVIHRGHIPTDQEVKNYGEYILSVILPILSELNSTCPDALAEAQITTYLDRNEAFPRKNIITTASHPTIINLSGINDPEFGKISIHDALEAMKSPSYSKIIFSKEPGYE